MAGVSIEGRAIRHYGRPGSGYCDNQPAAYCRHSQLHTGMAYRTFLPCGRGYRASSAVYRCDPKHERSDYSNMRVQYHYWSHVTYVFYDHQSSCMHRWFVSCPMYLGHTLEWPGCQTALHKRVLYGDKRQ